MFEELNKDGYKINGTKLQYLIAKNEMIRKILWDTKHKDSYTIAVTISGSDTDKINTYTEKEGL